MAEEVKTQVTVIEDNQNEGEKFHYILDLTNAQIDQIAAMLKEDPDFSIAVDTSFNQYGVTLANKTSSNTYMDAWGFYELVGPISTEEECVQTFYKGSGLKRITND